MSECYCNNCGKPGHNYSNCKTPITSIGAVCFRKKDGILEYLMICRKDTLGYIDFMRGKYSIYNKHYIMNMLKQMTQTEKANLRMGNFDTLWFNIWGKHSISTQYKLEESASREKFNSLITGILVHNVFYNLNQLIDESEQYDKWMDAEWGFPKGRRNYQEKDFECALREFSEETGYDSLKLHNVQNVMPLEEIFTGSNYKSYKHKYYLMYMDLNDSSQNTLFQKSEVSKMEWKTYDHCLESIRSYNIEKKRIIENINSTLLNYQLISLL